MMFGLKKFISFLTKMRYSLKIFFGLFFVLLVFLGLFFPSHLVLALSARDIADIVLGIATAAPAAAISNGLRVIGSVVSLFALLAGYFLQWVLSPSFTSLSYTNPAGPNGNPVIAAGLSITKNFANMILVLVLVYIALATILRLAGYETKKLLATFILVALLVNFAPVIVGLIVDASNIVMNFFVANIAAWSTFTKNLSSIWSGFFGDILKMFTGGFTGQMEVVARLVAVIIFNLFLALALFLFAALFAVRYVIIWILVILSPLAFVCYVLPVTKKYWTMWWHQLFQWSFIGVTAGFFLYLGLQVVSIKPLSPGAPSEFKGVFDGVFIYIPALIFLYLGWTIGFATSAMGAASVIGFTKKYGSKAKGWAKTGAFAGASKGLNVLDKELAKRGKGSAIEWAQRQAGASLSRPFGQGKGAKWAARAGWAVGATPAFWAIRKGIGEASLRLTEKERSDIKEAEDKYKGTTPERKTAGIMSPTLTPAARIGALKTAIEENQINDLKKGLKKLGLNDNQIEQEIIKIGQRALATSPEEFKKIRDAFPHLAEKMGEKVSKEIKEKAGLALTQKDKEKGLDNITQKIASQIKPASISKMDKDALSNNDVRKAFQLVGTAQHIREGVKAQGKEFLERFQKDFEEFENKIPRWHETMNRPLDRFMRGPAARGLGLGHPQSDDQKGAKKK